MYQVYKPNKNNTGSALSLTYNQASVWLSMIKQASWDSQKRTGSFKANKEDPNKTINCKVNINECASIIDAVRYNKKVELFHSNDKNKTIIVFEPYIKKGETEQVGFSLRLNRTEVQDSTNKASFVIGLTFGEAELLSQFMQFAIQKSFEESLQKFEAGKNKTQSKSPNFNVGKNQQAEQNEVVDEEDDIL